MHHTAAAALAAHLSALAPRKPAPDALGIHGFHMTATQGTDFIVAVIAVVIILAIRLAFR